MRLFSFLFFMTLFHSTRAQFTFSQTITEDTCLNYQAIEGIEHMFIPSSFGRDQLFQDRLSDSLKDKTILRIDLTYTLFKTDKNFDQARLNRMRWQSLHHRFPQLFENTATATGNVCQTLSTTAEEAKQQAHGFFVYYRKNTDSLTRAKEINEVENFLAQVEKQDDKKERPRFTDSTDRYTKATRLKKTRFLPPKPKRKLKNRRACREPFYKNGQADLEEHFTKNTEYKFRKKKKVSAQVLLALKIDGAIASMSFNQVSNTKFKDALVKSILLMEDWNGAYHKGHALKAKVLLNITASAKGGYKVQKTVIDPVQTITCGEVHNDSIFFPLPPNQAKTFLPDDNPVQNLLKQVLQRNTGLKNTLFVIDVTGSMSGYVVNALQILNDSVIRQKAQVRSVVLFNDGDNRNDQGKRVGHTGGVHQTDNLDPADLARFVVKVMRKGSGGDFKENNLEAILEGLRNCTACTDVVMVADNYATPRDVELVDQLKRPVHWILCGTHWGVNPAYLDLVRSNKGYGHTATTDFKELELMKEGETIDIDGTVYELKNNKFVKKDT